MILIYLSAKDIYLYLWLIIFLNFLLSILLSVFILHLTLLFLFFHFFLFYLVFFDHSFIWSRRSIRLSFLGYLDTFTHDTAHSLFSLDASFVILVLLSLARSFLPSLPPLPLSPATLLRRSYCAHSLRLSRSLPPLKRDCDRKERRGERVR